MKKISTTILGLALISGVVSAFATGPAHFLNRFQSMERFTAGDGVTVYTGTRTQACGAFGCCNGTLLCAKAYTIGPLHRRVTAYDLFWP